MLATGDPCSQPQLSKPLTSCKITGIERPSSLHFLELLSRHWLDFVWKGASLEAKPRNVGEQLKSTRVGVGTVEEDQAGGNANKLVLYGLSVPGPGTCQPLQSHADNAKSRLKP